MVSEKEYGQIPHSTHVKHYRKEYLLCLAYTIINLHLL